MAKPKPKPANQPLPLRPTKMEVVFNCYSMKQAQEAYREAKKRPEWKCTLVIMPAHTEDISRVGFPLAG